MAVGRRADADHRDPARHRRQAARLRRRPRRPRPRRARLRHRLQPQAPAGGAGRRGRASATSRSSRCPTRRRSSRSPRRPSPSSSTSSTRSCSAGWRSSAGSSGWCWRSAGWRKSPRRSPPRSAARWRSSTAAASASPGAASAASSPPTRSAAIRREALGHAGDGHPFVPSHPSLAGRALAHPVVSPGGGPPQAWVVIVRDSGGLGDFERLILQQSVAIVALELMRRRVARETERRLAGDVLAAALGGRMEPLELRRRLEPFGIGEEAAVLVFAARQPRRRCGALERALAADACPAVVAPHEVGGRELLCAVVDAADRDPIDVAADARRALIAERGAVRAAASRPARRSPCATPSTRPAARSKRPPSPTARPRRSPPGATSAPSPLLLSIQDDDALGLYCDSVLGPIEEGDEEYGGELLRSLEAFIEQNGQWERAAREVYLPPPHAALPDAQGRGADRPRPLARPRPDRVLAGPARAGELVDCMKVGVPTEIKYDEYRVAITPAGVREMSRARPRGADPGRRRRGLGDRGRALRAPGGDDRPRRRRRSSPAPR